MLDDHELHRAMKFIADEDSKTIELMPGWNKQLPFFGWFWRTFDWDKVPLGREIHEDKGGVIIGIMAKNKWYNQEYYCTPDESYTIRIVCEDIAKEYNAEKIKTLTLFLQTFNNNNKWIDCDKDAIDEQTKLDFQNGNYRLISLDDYIKNNKKEIN